MRDRPKRKAASPRSPTLQFKRIHRQFRRWEAAAAVADAYMEPCQHICPPTGPVLRALRNPKLWSCLTCGSTDGVWCCLTCGHVGCGRRAHLPALGGGHSRHHYQTMAATGVSGHEVCIDILSRAVHCYVCDEYVISDEPWLRDLRSEIEEQETRSLSGDDSGSDAEMEIDVDAAGSNQEKGSSRASSPLSSGPQLPPIPCPPSPVLTRCSARLGAQFTRPGCTGLRNLGNTCYMNSVLQSLSHCAGFRSFFMDFLRASAPLRLGGLTGKPKVRIDRQSTAKHLSQLQESNEEPDRLALTEATHALLRVLWSGRWKVVSPKAFVHAVWTHGGLFAARRQQDASEFLGFVLDRLDDELSPLSKAGGDRDRVDIGETDENATVAKEKKPVGPGTVLTDLFGITMIQEVTCDGCGTKTERREPLLGLYLSLPPQEQLSGRRRPRPVTLQSCLNDLVASERLTGDNAFDCDTCNARRAATKTVSLGRRPQTLIISFRRTLWTKAKGLHKDKRKVTFPLELDGTPLLSAHDVCVGGGSDCHYRLAALVSHSGSTPFCGHYISWSRVTTSSSIAGVANTNDNEACSAGRHWYLFNDSKVSPAEEAEVLNAEAFILFYERSQSGDAAAQSDVV